MMKNYILLLGVAGVVLGSYHAYADNDATMTVTATIAHDVNLGSVTDLNIGTITVNPSETNNGEIYYNLDGTFKGKYGDGVTAATSATPGTFTANIANPSACTGTSNTCGGLSVTGRVYGYNGVDGDNCTLVIVHDSENKFKVVPTACYYGGADRMAAGTYEKTITINYNAGG